MRRWGAFIGGVLFMSACGGGRVATEVGRVVRRAAVGECVVERGC